MRGGFLALLAGLVMAAPAASAEEPALLGASQARAIARVIVPRGRAPNAWADDVMAALERNGIRRTRENFCSVMAVIGQESSFTANPEVKGLGAMAEKEIADRLESLPALPGTAALGVKLYLARKPSPQNSYLDMIRRAKTERDLDLVFRNMVFALFRDARASRLLGSPAIARRADAVNPVSTLGSMQVSILFAIAETAKAEGRPLTMSTIWELRDALYTRAGGVYFGTRMLLGYRAGYSSRLYAFADYNAGRYASRNAAVQHMAAELSGRKLALDGDLLMYEKDKPGSAPSATEKALRRLDLGLSRKELRADLLLEKEAAFRDTETYRRLTALYAARLGRRPPHAMLPQIRLSSPKISSGMTTEIFARAVMRRHDRCMEAG